MEIRRQHKSYKKYTGRRKCIHRAATVERLLVIPIQFDPDNTLCSVVLSGMQETLEQVPPTPETISGKKSFFCEKMSTRMCKGNFLKKFFQRIFFHKFRMFQSFRHSEHGVESSIWFHIEGGFCSKVSCIPESVVCKCRSGRDGINFNGLIFSYPKIRARSQLNGWLAPMRSVQRFINSDIPCCRVFLLDVFMLSESGDPLACEHPHIALIFPLQLQWTRR